MSGAKATQQILYNAIVATDVLEGGKATTKITSEMEKWKGKNGCTRKYEHYLEKSEKIK